MIVSIFNNGKGNSKSLLYYLLKKKRFPKAEIFKGDVKLTKLLIDCNHRKYKYTSGVLAFRKEENPSNEELMVIVKAFERTFAPSIDEVRFPFLWVLHKDKGNTELHFVSPMQDAKTGIQLNICPPGKKFQQMFRDFQCLVNHRYQWRQVNTKRPNKPKLHPKLNDFSKITDSFKNHLEELIDKLILRGIIKNRFELIAWLECNGYTVTRQGSDYISIKNASMQKSIRLKGSAYNADVQYNAEIKSNDEFLSEYDLKLIQARLSRAIKNREKSLKSHLMIKDEITDVSSQIKNRIENQQFKNIDYSQRLEELEKEQYDETSTPRRGDLQKKWKR